MHANVCNGMSIINAFKPNHGNVKLDILTVTLERTSKCRTCCGLTINQITRLLKLMYHIMVSNIYIDLILVFNSQVLIHYSRNVKLYNVRRNNFPTPYLKNK